MEDESDVSVIFKTRDEDVTTRNIIGKTKTFIGLDRKEWIFLIISLINVMVCSALTIYRLVTIVKEEQTKTPDFTFTIIILVNAAFCVFYIVHGLLTEKTYEIYAFCGAVGVILVYCGAEYIVNADHRTKIKLIRLIAVSIAAPINIVLGVYVAHQFGWLEFRIIGASEAFQNIYREASRFSSIIKFDLQLSVTFVILVLTNGTKATLFDILCISIGLPVVLVTTVLGWFSVRKEWKPGVLVFGILLLIQPTFIIYQFVKVYIDNPYKDAPTLMIALLITGAFTLLIDAILYFEAFKVQKNFGEGLKERVFTSDESSGLLGKVKRWYSE